jgi:hypothetical protein
MAKYGGFFDEFDGPSSSSAFGGFFDEFETQPEPEPFKSNLFASFGIGANNLLGSVGSLYGLVSGDMDNMATRQAERGREFYEQFKTDELLEKQADLQARVDSADGELAKAGEAVWGTVTDLDLLGNFVLEQLPMAVPGGAVAKGASLLTKSARVGAGAGVVAGGGLQAGDVGGSVFDDLQALPDDIWNQNPEFVALSEQVGREEAKNEIALDASRKAASISGVISGVTAGALPNTIERTLARGGVKGDGFFSRALKGVGSESLQETLEEGGGQIAGNISVQPIDPTRETFEGVGQAAGLGALGGGILGGGVAGLSSPMQAATENAEAARADAVANGGDSLDAATAASGGFANTDLSALRERMNIEEPAPSTIELPELANQFDQDTLQPTPFQPIVTPTPFEPQQEVPQLPFDLTEEILFADRVNQPERATRLRNAQAIYDRAQGTADEGLRARLIERANAIVGTEMSQEFLRQPPVRDPSEPLEGPVITADTDVNFDASYVEQGPVVRTQRRPLLTQDNVIYQEPVEGAPDTVYQGSRGDGFATRKGADAAMKSRQKAEPGFNWEVFQDPNTERFALAGFRRERRQANPESVNNFIDQTNQAAQPEPEIRDTTQGLRESYEAASDPEMESRLIEIEDRIEQAQEVPPRSTSAQDVDVLTAITRLGGIQTDEAIAQGIDPESFRGYSGLGRPVRRNGLSFDDMGEKLAENGFFPERPTANEVLDLFTTAIQSNERIFVGESRADIPSLEAEQAEISRTLIELQDEFGPLTDDEIAFVDQYYQESFDASYGSQREPTQVESEERDVGSFDEGAGRTTLQPPIGDQTGAETLSERQATGSDAEIGSVQEDDGLDTSFQRGATRRPVINDEQFNSVLDRVVGQDGDARNRIDVRSSFAELPEEIQQAARDQGSDGNDISAVYHRGTVYLVKGKLATESQVEEALLHEGTHGGVMDMYRDQGVNKALNRMWTAMGGQKGFDKLARELGIEENVRPYISGMKGSSLDQDTRNAVLVNEMLAYTGQQGSKKLQQRTREAIGAIREWLRNNTFLKLSRMRASDISLVAKRARNNFLNNQSNAQEGRPSFIMGERTRAKQTPLKLYSNTEKVIIDQGDKLFKPSKKNPDASVRGDQIFSFLKGKGIKKDEAQYTEIEKFLTEDPSRRFTRDEVIEFLRDEAPELDERFEATTKTGFEIGEKGLEYSEPEVQDSEQYYEHIWDDIQYEIKSGDFEGRAGDVISNFISGNEQEVYDFLSSGVFDEDVTSKAREEYLSKGSRPQAGVYAFVNELGVDTVYPELAAEFESEIDDVAWVTAREDYINSSPYNTVTLLDDLDGVFSAQINGSDDYGWTYDIRTRLTNFNDGPYYDLDEAKVQVQNVLNERGYLDDFIFGDVEFLDYLKDVKEENWDQYREFVTTIDNKWGTYYSGHFGEDALFNVLATDRTNALGNVLMIEEMQSDWQSDIRRAGGPRDQGRIDEGKKELNDIDLESQRILLRISTIEQNTEARLIDPEISKVIGEEFGVSRMDAPGVLDPTPSYNKFLRTARRFFADKIQGNELPPFQTSKLEEAIKKIVDLDPDLDRNLQELAELEVQSREISRVRDDARRRLASAERAPPNVPFTEDRYAELALKRMLITAVEEGKDALMISSAAQLNERWGRFYEQIYDKKHVSTIGKLLGVKPYPVDVQGLDATAAYENALKAAGQVEVKYKDQYSDNNRYTFSAIFPSGSEYLGYEMLDIYTDKGMEAAKKQAEEKLRMMLMQRAGIRGWAAPISDEFKQKVTEEGLPMFQRDSARIYPKRPPEETIADKFIRTFQDKMVGLKRTQQFIEETQERKLDFDEDAYLAEEAFYGKTEEDLRQLEVRLIRPFIELLEKTGISVADLDEYLMARHAPERNRKIAAINDKLPDGGSGMTNAEAAEVIQRVNRSGKLADYNQLANQVYAMTQLTRDLVKAGGLASDEEVSSWESMYENYIPLRGFADDEVDSNGNRIRTGRGFDIRGKESRRALGRRSKAKSPTAQVIADLTEKTIRNRKNEVGQTFLNLVEGNPDPDMWEVFTDANPDTEEQFRNGSVREGPVNMAGSDKYYAVKRDGVVHYIKVKDQRLLNAMQNVGPERLSAVTKVVAGMTRFLASVNTSYNPQFVVTNFARDIQAAALNLAAEATMEGGKLDGNQIAGKVVAGTVKAIRAIRSSNKQDAVNDDSDPEATEYRRYYQEFLNDGAKTGYFDSPDVDTIAADLEKKLGRAGPGTKNELLKAGTKIAELVEKYNSAVENGVRLSAYIEARKAGVDRKQAASLAKNMTVNFNRKGEIGTFLNSLYMFFNAAVQGTTQFLRTLSPLQVNSQGNIQVQRNLNLAQKIAGGIVAGGAGFASLMREMGGEDDDGEAYWDKIPAGIRERNFIIMKPGSGGDYYKLPLPYGYNFFWNLGDSLEGVLKGSQRRRNNVLGDLVSSFTTSFSPFSLHRADNAAQQVALTISPSIVLPVTELAVNTNYFGEKIYPENFPGGAQKADAYLYWPSTKEPYVRVAKFLNDVIGGGSEYRSGELMGISTDVSPETLQQIIEYAGGGLLRTATGTGDSIFRPVTGRQLEIANVPFARVLVGKDQSDYGDIDTFYERRQEIINARKEYNDAPDSEARRASDEGFDGIRRLYPQANNVYKRLRSIREREMRIRDRDDLSPADREQQLEALRESKDDIVDRFNKRFDEFMQDRAG